MGFWDDDPLAGGGFIYDGHEVSNEDPNYEALLDAYLDGRPFESALEEMDNGWGIPAYDENEEQDDVNPAVSDYEDWLAREGDLWEGKSYEEALALEASWEEEDEEGIEGVEFGLDEPEYWEAYDEDDYEDDDDW